MNKYELLKKQIEDKFPNIVVDKKWSAMEISIQTTQAMLNSLSMVLIVVLLVFAVLNIIIVVLMDNFNWRKKFGILKSLGFTSHYIIRQNICKYMMITFISTIFALILHLSISQKLMATLLLDAFTNSPVLLFIICFCFVGAIFSAAYVCSLNIKRISVIELMEE